MATATRTTTWSDNQVLSASALNGEFNNLLNALSLVNADISGSAAISESKITFSASGHGHTGGTDGKLIASDGWTPTTDSWTYASANTVNVPTGAASIYQVGDRVKFTQTTVKYFAITTVADTLLSFAVNTDYTVANAAISAISYSHQENPLGYPSFFNFTPSTITWDGTPPSTATTLAKFAVNGRICTVEVRISYTGAGTTNTQFTMDAPIAVRNGQASKFLTIYPCYMGDNAFAGAPVSYQAWGGTYATGTLYVNHNGAAIAANAVALWAQYEI